MINDLPQYMIYTMTIPWDIVNILYTYDRKKFVNTCKEFNEKYKKENESAKKIQEWCDKYGLCTILCDNMSKMRLVYYYKLNYEWNCLKTYPTFLVNKCNKLYLLEKAKTAELVGTRQSIIEFLYEPSITKDDILYAGW